MTPLNKLKLVMITRFMKNNKVCNKVSKQDDKLQEVLAHPVPFRGLISANTFRHNYLEVWGYFADCIITGKHGFASAEILSQVSDQLFSL